jgi:hypothetical protein
MQENLLELDIIVTNQVQDTKQGIGLVESGKSKNNKGYIIKQTER